MTDIKREPSPAAVQRTSFAILGTGRTGSTFLYQALKAHPDIAITNEAKILDFIALTDQCARTESFKVHPDLGFQGMISSTVIEPFTEILRAHLLATVDEFYARVFAGHDYKCWGDKMLTATHVPGLRELWPEMRCIVLVRDPRDGFCSSRAHYEKPALAEIAAVVGKPAPLEYAQDWATTYRSLLDNLVEPCLWLRYEDMMAARAETVAQVLEFLGQRFVREVKDALELGEFDRGHRTAKSTEQSINRWKQELDGDEVRAIEEVCGDLMPRFDYELS